MQKPTPSRDTRQPTLSRRTVFAGAGAAGAAAAAVAVLPGVIQSPESPAATDAPAADGYRLTAHIRRYYETTKV
ncbi:formate dehydrogenase [Hydrogenophaga sp. BPS33]|uniref:formate dehydrogenase n=1 Tax=Hydrogenophaga sp. BPS33 TaxID=2651974 RepID=UPI00131F9947|nr:formate dehydrogenase [Hydrogenophaga sp. BPS33]QHE84555.1 formate dehydrogenase [Hydrogenophaga sp. BPS33]